jgi:RimJ/RimL family protein N-acetyltransferase
MLLVPKIEQVVDLTYTLMDSSQIEWARLLHNDDSTLLQLTDPEYISQEQQLAWFKSMSLSRTSKRFVVTASWVVKGETVSTDIGVFRADAIDYKNRSVMVGLDLANEWRGRGLARSIYGHFLSYYFDQCGMNRMHLKVLDTNKRAIHVYESVGFKEEGRERQAVFRGGQFRDYICMSILRSEYDDRRNPDRDCASKEC